MGLLGDHNAKVLLNTMVFEVGFFFALRSGNEHRRLRHSPSPIPSANVFYLSPLAKPKGDVWYSRTPLGHNVLGRIVNEMMADAGFEGHFTKHSLRVSLATRLYDAEVDEQLIMSRTGHSSTDGVRAYKRTSEKLKKMTSAVLNNSNKRTLVNKEEPEQEPCTKRVCGEEDKENGVHPVFQISGGSNITINIS